MSRATGKHAAGENDNFPTLKPAPKWPGYFVGSDGSVWSRKSGTLRRLATHLDQDGYPAVQFWFGGCNHRVVIHRLVARAFHRRVLGAQVRHLNGDRTDNRAANLRWGSARDNARDRELHGNTARGERNGGGRKLTIRDVLKIRQLVLRGVPNPELAKRYNVMPCTISAIKHRRLWKHV